MARRNPEVQGHPSTAWIDTFVMDSDISDQNQTQVPVEERLTLSNLKLVLRQDREAQNERLAKAEAAVEALQARNALAKVDHRNTRLDKRKREKQIHLAPYKNQHMKHHAGDLYDIGVLLEDVCQQVYIAISELGLRTWSLFVHFLPNIRILTRKTPDF